MGSKFYRVQVTAQAEKQIEEISYYLTIDLSNPEAAIHFIDLIQKTVVSLHEMPQRISLTNEAPWGNQGVHKINVGNYLMYFWIDEEQTTVQIIGVVHSSRDQRRLLKKMKHSKSSH